MDKKTERLIYIYKRGLEMLATVTEEEVKKYLDCTYAEYVQGVAKKHLELAKKLEPEQLFWEEEWDDTVFDEIIAKFSDYYQTCEKCGKTDIETQYDHSLGITLCNECYKEFK